MWRMTWRQLVTHKLRVGLTAVAVILGVMFVSASLVFTDTMSQALHKQAAKPVPGLDVVVSADDRSGLTEAQLSTLEGVDGVAKVAGEISGYAGVVGHDGKVLHRDGNRPRGHNWSGGPGRKMTSGRPPERAGEFAMDRESAADGGLHVGDRVPLVIGGDSQTNVLVGLFSQDSALRAGTTAMLDTATAQKYWGTPGRVDSAVVTAASGVTQQQLADRITAVLHDAQIDTNDSLLREENAQIDDDIRIFQNALLAFAAIAIVTGGLVIVNTFSVLVSQRTREIGLLRIVGASRRQVRRLVLGEAFAVGIVGGTVGLCSGLGVAALLRMLLARLGEPLPDGPLVMNVRTMLVAYAVGVIVTVLAAYMPARRAARVTPIAALRESAGGSDRSLVRRTVLGAVLGAGGVAAMIAGGGMAFGPGVTLVGFGLVATLIGATLAGPALCQPVLRVVGAPLSRVFSARLGSRNALRSSRRTAATAAALMVGLTLVTGIGVATASLKKSVRSILAEEVHADFVLTNLDDSGIGPQAEKDLAALPGVRLVAPLRDNEVKINGEEEFPGALPPDAVGSAIRLTMLQGKPDLRQGVLVSKSLADERHWKVGKQLPMTFYRGKETASIVGVYDDSAVIPDMLISDAIARAHFDPRALPSTLLVVRADGSDADQVKAAVEQAVRLLPSINVQTGAEFRDELSGSADNLLAFIYALLGLAILTAVVGIVNTLALSVFERTREIGLLRAVGLSRRQLRGCVRMESVLIAVFGAVLGIAAGIGFGAALQRAAADSGFTELVIPLPQLGISVFGAILVGVLAAAWPARRAARMNTLQAIASE